MYQIILSDDGVVIRDQYRLISSTTTIKNKKGETKKYTSYNCSFPYPFLEMLDFPKEVYFYIRLNRTYITDEEPPDYYDYKKVMLQTRKNKGQKSSKENENKKWAKLIAIPKLLLGEYDDYKTLHYTIHCNKRDYVTNRIGLIEVNLSKRDFDDWMITTLTPINYFLNNNFFYILQ